VRTTLQLAPSLPLVAIDSIQIQQVLLNLVRNAVQALETSASADREVTISTAVNSANEVEVRVRDNGPGLDQRILDRLFLPFATTKSDGTGLGLAISRSIIESHKGTLDYEANIPHGACFVFRLPITGSSDP
jgi:signal transduction histidine kinase